MQVIYELMGSKWSKYPNKRKEISKVGLKIDSPSCYLQDTKVKSKGIVG